MFKTLGQQTLRLERISDNPTRYDYLLGSDVTTWDGGETAPIVWLELSANDTDAVESVIADLRSSLCGGCMDEMVAAIRRHSDSQCVLFYVTDRTSGGNPENVMGFHLFVYADDQYVEGIAHDSMDMETRELLISVVDAMERNGLTSRSIRRPVFRQNKSRPIVTSRPSWMDFRA